MSTAHTTWSARSVTFASAATMSASTLATFTDTSARPSGVDGTDPMVGFADVYIPFVAADALVLKVREGGRTVNVHALLASGVNGDGYREILGLHVTSSEDGAGWLGFFRDLVARGLSGIASTRPRCTRSSTASLTPWPSSCQP